MKRLTLPILENARIASPCNVSWASMKGDERTRYCDQCNHRVYNLVGMSESEVAQLFESQGDDLCIRLYQRPDGTLLTEDCPVGLRAVRKRVRRALATVGAAAAFLLTAGLARSHFDPTRRSLRVMSPYSRIANWLNPAPLIPATLSPKPSTRYMLGKVRPPMNPNPNGSAGVTNTSATACNGGAT